VIWKGTAMKNATLAAIILAGGTFASPVASANTITFSGFTDQNGTPVETYTESGFTITRQVCAFCGQFFQDQQFGNPAPSLLATPAPGITALYVTANDGGLFSFHSVDLAANNGNVNYEFEGLDGGQQFFVLGVVMGRPPGVFGFDTVVNSFLNNGVGELRILLISPASGSANVDNIVVNPCNSAQPCGVPSPVAGAGLPGLILAGAGFLAWWRRQQKIAWNIRRSPHTAICGRSDSPNNRDL
jgi:hypothetical protein